MMNTAKFQLYTRIVEDKRVKRFGFVFGTLIPAFYFYFDVFKALVLFVAGQIPFQQIKEAVAEVTWTDLFQYIGMVLVISALWALVYLYAKIQLTLKEMKDFTKKAALHSNLIHWLDNIRFKFIKEKNFSFIYELQEKEAFKKKLAQKKLSDT